MSKIVITGATSFLGVHIIKEWLKEKDVEIFAIVRPNSKNLNRIPINNSIKIIELDKSEYNRMAELLYIYIYGKVDYFYHLAWEGGRIPLRYDENLHKQNYESSLVAFEQAKKLGCKLFIGTGSQSEYGKMNKTFVNENFECNPQNAYGIEKLHTCNKLTELAKKSDIKFIWVRIFSVYGKYDYEKTLISSAIKQLKNNQNIDMTLCTQKWDYLYVKDAAIALKMFAKVYCKEGIYNLASGDIRPLKEYIKELIQITNSKSTINFGAVPYGPNGPIELLPDITKIKTELNWNPQYTFKDGIIDLLNEE